MMERMTGSVKCSPINCREITIVKIGDRDFTVCVKLTGTYSRLIWVRMCAKMWPTLKGSTRFNNVEDNGSVGKSFTNLVNVKQYSAVKRNWVWVNVRAKGSC